MKLSKSKKRHYYLTRTLLLGLALTPLLPSPLVWAADITTPIFISDQTVHYYTDDIKITTVTNGISSTSKVSIGANKNSSGININNNFVDINVTAPTTVDTSLLYAPSGTYFDINTKTLSLKASSADNNTKTLTAIKVYSTNEVNITAEKVSINLAGAGELNTIISGASAGIININSDLKIDVNAVDNNAADRKSTTLNTESSFGNFVLNGDLDVNVTGSGKEINGFKGPNTSLNGSINTITMSTDAATNVKGLLTSYLSTAVNSLTTINISNNNTAEYSTGVCGLSTSSGNIGSSSKLNIIVNGKATGLSNKYADMRNGTNGMLIASIDTSAPTFVAQAGSELNIQVSGSAVDQTTGLNGAAGFSTNSGVAIDGKLNINILSDKGVGIKIVDQPTDNTGTTIKWADMNVNGDLIVNASGGYALLSASSQAAYRDLNIFSGRTNLNINPNGGSLVQLVGDIDHLTLANSTIKINMDRTDSYLRGSSLRTNNIEQANEPIKGNQTDIRLANGATWYMTGKSDINTSGNSIVNKLEFVNQGYLDMTPSDTANSYGFEKLYANQLAGTAGKILMNTDLQASHNQTNALVDSDRIIINQYSDSTNTILNPASAGIHTIDVKDTSLLTKQPAEGYLLLVEDHTKGNATFVGGNLEKGGIFKYKPIITNVDPTNYGVVPADSTNWYLTGFAQNGLQEEVFVNAGLAESRYIAYMNEQDTLIKRLGELRQHDKEKGIWVRIRGANNSVDGYGLNRNSYVSTHLGYDWKLKEKETSRTKRYIGVAFNHTNNNFDYTANATGKGQSNVLTIYGTRLGDKGHYLDLVGKLGRMSNDYKYQGQQVEAKNWFYSLSAEYGRSIVRDKGWYYEPQVQFTYGHINGANYRSSETNISADSINSAILRAGILAGRKFNEDKPEKNGSYYAKLFYNHEFGGDVKASMTDVYGDRFDFKHSYSGSWMTVGLGTSLNLNKKTNLYLDVEKAFGGKVSGGWAWQGGVRWRF